jgi:hypothetical protein
VIQLRDWSSDRVYSIPTGVTECPVGAEPSDGIQLLDPRGHVSRKHARLVRDGAFWVLEDAGSKNGIGLNRARQEKILLVPGLEVGIGSLTLVAETRMMVDLRAYLARVVGWDVASPHVVGRAVSAIRDAAYARAALVIGGADDLVAVARQIHLRTATPGAPFVVAGRFHQVYKSLRVTSHPDAIAAYHLAAGGTVCVRAEEPPKRYEQLVQLTSDRLARAQLMVCAQIATAPSITVPELHVRSPSQLSRIVAEYAADSIRELAAAPTSFTEANHAWVMAQVNAATSFADLEIATLRLVALNETGSVHAAAARLGYAHGNLGKWYRRRRIKVEADRWPRKRIRR